MRMLPKTYFWWLEPKPFIRLGDSFEKSGTRWWVPLGTVIGASALPFIIWYSVRRDWTENPPSFETVLFLTLFSGAFAVCAIFWGLSLCSSDVFFSKKYIFRRRGNAIQQLAYEQFDSFEWRENDRFFTLILKSRNPGKEVYFGVPLSVPRGVISAFLIEHKLQGFQEKCLQWNEPKAFIRSLLNSWAQFAGFVFFTAFFSLALHFGGNCPPSQRLSLSTAIASGLSLSVLFAYLLPWWNARFGSFDVRLFEQCLLWQRGIGNRFSYEDFASFSWRQNDQFATLILRPRKPGKEISIGVPFDLPREEVTAFLIERHLKPEGNLTSAG